MAERFLLKDHLFNAETVGALAARFAAADPGFDADAFTARCLSRFPELELKARIAWIAEVLENHLPRDFPAAAGRIEAALPPPLDPARSDDDFGHFIHAPLGVYAERNGMDHPERALNLLHAVTQRFSMELSLRAFLAAHPGPTEARLRDWAASDNYHVRRLVSEGTRPRLPWGRAIPQAPGFALPLLDRLHADRTRFVTRSVANHLNDLCRTMPEAVLARLAAWRAAAGQDERELAWMTRHALRGLVKAGDPAAMAHLGYRPVPDVRLTRLDMPKAAMIGGAMTFALEIAAGRDEPMILDYRLHLQGARAARRVIHRLKDATARPGAPLRLRKAHKFKADATTFTLYPGPARLTVLANGTELGSADFTLHPAPGA